jgi:hypothetical protein
MKLEDGETGSHFGFDDEVHKNHGVFLVLSLMIDSSIPIG